MSWQLVVAVLVFVAIIALVWWLFRRSRIAQESVAKERSKTIDIVARQLREEAKRDASKMTDQQLLDKFKKVIK